MPPLRKIIASLAASLAFVGALFTLPVAWCERNAQPWFEGQLATQATLANTVVDQLTAGLSRDDYSTGSDLFDGEWLFGTCLMSGIGLCQLAAEHPESLARWQPGIELAIEQLLTPEVRAFDREAWGNDALETLAGGRGHAAYLGYFNYLLSLYRTIAPENRFAELNNRLTAELTRRLESSPIGLIETYPGERYPVDNAPVLGSIALHARATGTTDSERLAKIAARYRATCIDPGTGLLIQAVDHTGYPADEPRGSGTSLAIFFLHNTHPDMARGLYDAVKEHLATTFLGFGAVNEYPAGVEERTDIDSGPIIMGMGFSSTGFSLAGARIFSDRPFFRRLFASAWLAGAPITSDDRLQFVTGGPLGNAILLAVLTAPPQAPAEK